MAVRSIQDVLTNARIRLVAMGTDQPRLEAEILFRHVLGLGTREFLLLDYTENLDSTSHRRFEELLVRRLASEPLQYILGTAQFGDFDFAVGPGVLIPRPETEVLVETVSRYVSEDLEKAGILVDVGTGTGVIAISLLTRFPKWIGVGLDLSETALSYARENSKTIRVADRFLPLQADLLGCLAGREAGVDLVVSNPPYIPTSEIRGLAPEVRDREPLLALDGGADGMVCTRGLLSDAARVLRPGGLLALELALGQADAVRNHAEGEGFLHRETYQDLTGRERGVILRRV